jgi:hypothetical protein
MLFQSLSLRSDQGNILLILVQRVFSITAMLPVPISHKGRNTSLTSAIHIAFHDVVLGVLVAFLA